MADRLPEKTMKNPAYSALRGVDSNLRKKFTEIDVFFISGALPGRKPQHHARGDIKVGRLGNSFIRGHARS